jgi:hypothetical protein
MANALRFSLRKEISPTLLSAPLCTLCSLLTFLARFIALIYSPSPEPFRSSLLPLSESEAPAPAQIIERAGRGCRGRLAASITLKAHAS